MRAEKVTAALLSNAAPVTAIVGSKIFAVLGGEREDAPYLVFWKESASRQPQISMGGEALVYATMTVQGVALDYDTLKALCEAVRVALVMKYGLVAGVQVNDIQAADEGPDFYDPELQLYSQLWQFNVTHQE